MALSEPSALLCFLAHAEPAQWAYLMRRLLGIQMGAGGGLRELGAEATGGS